MKLSSAHSLYKSSGCHSLGWLPWGMLKRRLEISICGYFRQKLELLVKHQTHQHQPGMLCVLAKRQPSQSPLLAAGPRDPFWYICEWCRSCGEETGCLSLADEGPFLIRNSQNYPASPIGTEWTGEELRGISHRQHLELRRAVCPRVSKSHFPPSATENPGLRPQSPIVVLPVLRDS